MRAFLSFGGHLDFLVCIYKAVGVPMSLLCCLAGRCPPTTCPCTVVTVWGHRRGSDGTGPPLLLRQQLEGGRGAPVHGCFDFPSLHTPQQHLPVLKVGQTSRGGAGVTRELCLVQEEATSDYKLIVPLLTTWRKTTQELKLQLLQG